MGARHHSTVLVRWRVVSGSWTYFLVRVGNGVELNPVQLPQPLVSSGRNPNVTCELAWPIKVDRFPLLPFLQSLSQHFSSSRPLQLFSLTLIV